MTIENEHVKRWIHSGKSGLSYKTILEIAMKLHYGWEIDLYSTFLSRKSYHHCLIGKIRLVKVRL